MAGLLALLIIAGLIFWLLWYLFVRSILWVAQPLIEHFENKEAEKFMVEEVEAEEPKIEKRKVKIVLEGLDKPIHLPETLLQKAQTKPQKLPNTNLWIYKDYIFSSTPTPEKIKEIFGEERAKSS